MKMKMIVWSHHYQIETMETHLETTMKVKFALLFIETKAVWFTDQQIASPTLQRNKMTDAGSLSTYKNDQMAPNKMDIFTLQNDPQLHTKMTKEITDRQMWESIESL